MIDIETLGLEPGCIVLSIGAVTFDKNGVHEEFYCNIDMKSCDKVGLDVDVNTLQWWLEQGEEAQSCLIGGIPLETALNQFTKFYVENGCSEIWANSPAMDCSVLEKAYEAVGLEEPWNYDEERDYRTLEILGSTPDIKKGVAHNALDDAKYQAKVAMIILRNLY